MTITKLGHCTLVLEVEGKKFLTDPGSFTIEVQQAVTGLSAVIITHEHQDHFHVDSLKVMLANNPQAVVVTNAAVAKLIETAGINSTIVVVEDGGSTQVDGVLIEGFGKDHALVYPPNLGLVENTGYFIANKFYFPGDNFHPPSVGQVSREVDILALPVAGPWMKMSEAIDFAKEINPRVAFSVHDGMVVPDFRGYAEMAVKRSVPQIRYVSLADGESRDF